MIFFFSFSTSVDGERTQQQQPPINDIFFSNSSSFIRNLSDKKRSEPYVLCQIFSDGQTLCMPVQTSFKSFTDKWKYEIMISFFFNSSFFFHSVGMNG